MNVARRPPGALRGVAVAQRPKAAAPKMTPKALARVGELASRVRPRGVAPLEGLGVDCRGIETSNCVLREALGVPGPERSALHAIRGGPRCNAPRCGAVCVCVWCELCLAGV